MKRVVRIDGRCSCSTRGAAVEVGLIGVMEKDSSACSGMGKKDHRYLRTLH